MRPGYVLLASWRMCTKQNVNLRIGIVVESGARPGTKSRSANSPSPPSEDSRTSTSRMATRPSRFHPGSLSSLTQHEFLRVLSSADPRTREERPGSSQRAGQSLCSGPQDGPMESETIPQIKEERRTPRRGEPLTLSAFCGNNSPDSGRSRQIPEQINSLFRQREPQYRPRNVKPKTEIL